jgi:murein DD-endopeptidase MepM/ murein hydrolase activator NlpD
MKILFHLLLATSFIYGANIEDKIESAQVKIDSKKSQEKRLSHQLDKIAGEISSQTGKLKKLSNDIDLCKGSIKTLKKKTLVKGSELQKIEKIYKKLAKKEKMVSDKVVNTLSKELSIDIISTGKAKGSDELASYDKTEYSIVMNEVLHTYVQQLKKSLKKDKSRYIKLNKSMDLVKRQISKLSNKVDALKSKKEMLAKLNKTQKSNIQSLLTKKKHYVKRLNRIKKEQNSLASTLQKLNITKVKRDNTIIKESGGSVNVRQIGSSYQQGKLVKYRGEKTISPLKSYTIAQKFGNYVDPIYKIKIFNESVILKARSKNAKVINVLDGSVIYADKTPMLEHVVIVKNKNNIHTIYAHLSKIAPTVRVGKRLKKGYVLGRVQRELTFEVTQNERHLNPMRLIK